MNDLFNKAGIYEAISVLLVGMTVIMTGAYLDLPVVKIESMDNDFMQVCFFLVISYSVGIFFLEVGRLLDKKLLKIQNGVWLTFLSNSKSFVNPLELNEYRNLANRILGKDPKNTIFSKSDNMYVFYYCKGFLEVHGKDGKVEKHESLGDMSRSLMIAFPILTISYVIMNHQNVIWYKVLFLLLFTLLFYLRMKKYAYYRVRVLMRHYRALTTEHPIR